MSSYEINSDEQYYGLTFDDNISKHFDGQNLCGPLIFDDVKDKNSILADPVEALVTIVGIDSVSGIEVQIFASDYTIISKDEIVTLKFDFHNDKANAVFSEEFDIELLWVDICSTDPTYTYLLVKGLTDITHSVITPTSDTVQSFDYSLKDCYGTCGGVKATLSFPDDAPSGLSSVVTVDPVAKTITVSKTTDYTLFGTYLV